MTGLFKPMRRYQSQCFFCKKQTDVMAYNEEDAAVRFSEKGWRSIKIASQESERTVAACKRCARIIEKTKESEIKKV